MRLWWCMRCMVIICVNFWVCKSHGEREACGGYGPMVAHEELDVIFVVLRCGHENEGVHCEALL